MSGKIVQFQSPNGVLNASKKLSEPDWSHWEALFEPAREKIIEAWQKGEISMEEVTRMLDDADFCEEMVKKMYRRKGMNKTTVWVVILMIFIGILGWDVWLYLDDVPGNSISQVIIETSKEYRIIAWAIGFLMGFLTSHFYDPEAQK